MRLLSSAHGEVLDLAFAPDGQAIAAAVEHHGVFLWNLGATGTPVRLDPESQKPRDLYFSPDGRVLHWLSFHGWKAHDREIRRTVECRLNAPGRVLMLARTPDGSRLVSGHNFPGSALIGWAHTGEGYEQEWAVSTATVALHSPSVCPSGHHVAVLARAPRSRLSGEDPFRLEIRSAVSGAVKATGRYPYGYECPLVFSPDGELLVGVRDMTLLVWSVSSPGQPALIRNVTRQHFTAAAFHPSGRYLIATSNDTTVHVFETGTWRRVTRFNWEVGRLRVVTVSPDGMLAAAGGDAGQVVIWDVDV